MRIIIISIIIISLALPKVFSQEKKQTFRAGTGYYMDVLGLVGGQSVWLDSGIKLKTGFNINSKVSLAYYSWKMSEGNFKGYKTISLIQMLDISFSRPMKLKGKHWVEPSIGFRLKRDLSFYPDFDYIYSGGSYNLSTKYSENVWGIGLVTNIDYNYQFASGFYIGLRTDVDIIYGLGFEGLSISPIFDFRF